jgi:ribosomal 50S subunit-recycling heat shock protein
LPGGVARDTENSNCLHPTAAESVDAEERPSGRTAAVRRGAAGCFSNVAHRAKGRASLMRLDKFMKVSRLAKRRAEAKDGIEAGRITKDGRALKPGYDVKAGDVLVIHYRTKFLTVRVLLVPERVLPSLKPADLYEIVEERKDDPVDWLHGA